MTNFNDVGEFHRKFGLHHVVAEEAWDNTHEVPGAGPQPPNDDLLNFRIKFLCEELQEFLEACGIPFNMGVDDTLYSKISARVNRFQDATAVDHAQAADALIDLVYVAMGTAHVMGYPWEELWDDVQRANMSKKRAAKDGSDSSSGREPEYDVIKPEGWRGPNTSAILGAHGFTPPVG
jgi:predicted HAD superfamily Cof-like phosphohydrolase